ncbi:hypothetical protein SAMN05216570_2623 [Dyella sp. OK004]|uniref:EF-hand domain-containing protein n=1 Tax=Dyella sp. OK004 TaxID=1855292 RepID=UPI0008E9B1A1|nr:EF-hand domain-containing protein [Dyella sp. OK004]SFS12174.1 hypothetical protein SAMN05216570_2623 [Dyella sp. OK004]
MYRIARTALIVAIGLGLPMWASAQAGVGRLASKLDMASKNFDAADRDHDGMLTKDEAEKGNVPFIAHHFDQIDREHRGKVSKQDVAAYLQSRQRPAPAAASSAAKPD